MDIVNLYRIAPTAASCDGHMTAPRPDGQCQQSCWCNWLDYWTTRLGHTHRFVTMTIHERMVLSLIVWLSSFVMFVLLYVVLMFWKELIKVSLALHLISSDSKVFSKGSCGVVGSILAFRSIGHGFKSKHSLFLHLGASAFSKPRSLAKRSLDDSVRRLLSFTQLATLRGTQIE